MKNKIFSVSALFIFIFSSLTPPLGAAEELPFPDPEAAISMDFQDANLKDILKIFSVQSGLNFIASQAVQERKITLYMDQVPIKEAMDKLFKANNLSYDMEEDSNIFIVKDWGIPATETITKVFYLKHATVTSSPLRSQMAADMASGSGAASATSTESDITAAVKKLLTTNGVVVEDHRTNSLIVTDIPSKMPVIAQTIALLDVAVPQIMIEVEMLDVSKNVVDRLGFDHGTSPFTFIFGSRHITGGTNRNGLDVFIGDFGRRGASILEAASGGSVLLGRTFAETLDFLRTQTDTKYLARPRLLTLNNETAEIKIAADEAVGVTTTTTSAEGTGSTTAEAERAETGVSLRVTPQINTDTGEITLFIYPEVTDATGTSSFLSGGTNNTFANPEKRSTKSIVRIKDGDTVMMGGLIRNESSLSFSKLPILGDIPILGALFRHKGSSSDKNKQRELLVFITPRIVKDKNWASISGKKAELPVREQKSASAFDRQLAVSASLNNFEKTR